jgi:Family of unknown function (DUF6230)
MKDALGSQVLGGTKWKRFALVMVPTVGIAGAMTVAMANGVLASSFAVSGQQFKVSADSLDGQTFAQSGDVIVDANGQAHAVAVAGIKSAKITNMCQSVVVPVPVLGNLSIILRAGGGGTPVSATDLVLDTNQVDADATFSGVVIGASAADIAGKTGIQGFEKHTGKPDGSVTPFAAGDFGQVVDHAVLTGVRQTAYSTTAGTMALKGLSISANLSDQACF